MERDLDKRNDEQINQISKYIKNESFLGTLSYLKQHDIKDLASSLQFKFVKKGENVFTCGDFGKKFYMIMSGLVTFTIPFSSSLTEKQYVSIWQKFRDITIDQYKEADLREEQMHQEHHKK